MTTYKEFSTALESILLTNFGYSSFREGQLQAIETLLFDGDLIAIMPTGSGKSLIYQFVAMLKPGLTVVVSPLIALMKDQVDGLVARGIPATYINSTLSPYEQSERLELLAQGVFKIVYVAPERLRQYFFQEEVLNLDVSLLAVDEAHCISHWGHDFRPDYLYISEFRQAIGNPATVALTATATPRVRKEIISQLQLNSPKMIIQGFDRANINLQVRRIDNNNPFVRKKAKLSVIADLLRKWDDGAAIVYTGTRSDSEKVSWFLNKQVGVPAKHYHAGMETFEREEVQDWFANGHSPIIVATNAFGMGIDRSDVRMIIHHQIPGSLEAYYQEIGRAGRDGKAATAVLLYHPDDRGLQDYFIENSTLSRKDLRMIFDILSIYSNGHTHIRANYRALSNHCGFDEEGVKVRVGLRRLEEAGVIEQGYYEGIEQHIYLHAWKKGRIKSVVNQIAAHAQQKQYLLVKMLNFAENTTVCRRRIILEYFEDSVSLPTNNSQCCDVCRPIPFVAKSSIARAILETVNDHPGRFSRLELAADLCGDLSNRGKHSGRLSYTDQSKVRREMERLFKNGSLKRAKCGRLVLPIK